MEDVRDRKFRNELVFLDDKNFIDCEFLGCQLEYHGGPVTFFESPVIRCHWSFGSAAHRTINLLQFFDLEIAADPIYSDLVPMV
ncbi:MAG: hypothetical protein ACRYFU_05240, partial [Janthinobacterium lividum]